MKVVTSKSGNVFSKKNWRWEYIFEEKELFKIPKKTLKIFSNGT